MHIGDIADVNRRSLKSRSLSGTECTDLMPAMWRENIRYQSHC